MLSLSAAFFIAASTTGPKEVIPDRVTYLFCCVSKKLVGFVARSNAKIIFASSPKLACPLAHLVNKASSDKIFKDVPILLLFQTPSFFACSSSNCCFLVSSANLSTPSFISLLTLVSFKDCICFSN